MNIDVSAFLRDVARCKYMPRNDSALEIATLYEGRIEDWIKQYDEEELIEIDSLAKESLRINAELLESLRRTDPSYEIPQTH